MKRDNTNRKKLIAILLAAAMLSLGACGKSDSTPQVDGTADVSEGSDNANEDTEAATEEKIDIPEKYSLLDEGKVTEYKNQHQSGMCWAFTVASAAESSLIVSGFEDSSVDLSEGHICYSVYQFAEDRAEDSTEDGIYVFGDKKKNKTVPYYIGGSCAIVVQQFAIGAGPVYESEAPINTDAGQLEKSVDNIFQLESEGKLTKYMGNYLLTQSMIYESDEDIKRGLIKNGAACIAVYIDQKGGGKDSQGEMNYFLTDRNSPPKETNHVVTVIGWDDNYSKENFKNTPANDGAWLIKDSIKGTGYYWMSYDEYFEYREGNEAQCMKFCKRDDYGQILSYDGIGPTTGIKADGEYTTVSNVFKTDASNIIKGVGISTNVSQQKVNVSIYKNPEDGNPESGEKLYEKEYTIAYKGYEVVNIDEPVNVDSGEKFSVVVKYTNVDGIEEIAPVEGDGSIYPKSALGEIYIVSSEGESFALAGDIWYDLSKQESSAVFNKTELLNNACIKVLMSD